MIVREVMHAPAATCAPDDDLGTAVKAMREHDCGFLPVVDTHGIVVGVVTDRDICLAAGAARRPLNRVSANETMSHPVFSCFPDENLKVVLATMARHHVRRLPVLDRNGHLLGVLSTDDIVQAPPRRGAPTAEEVVAALKGICTPPALEAATA